MAATMKAALFLAVLALGFSVGCTPKPPPTPTVIPSQTAVPVLTETPTPTPFGPVEPVAPAGISRLEMFADGGWGIDETGGKLYRVSNSGGTWTEISLLVDVSNGLSRSAFLDADTSWIPVGQVLLHTQDGGQNWDEIQVSGLEFQPSPMVMKFSSPTQGWIERYEGGAGSLYIQVFQTIDGGATFQVVPILPPEPEPNLPEGLLHLCNICQDAFYFDPARIVVVEGDLGTMQPRGSVHIKTTFDLGAVWNNLVLPLPDEYQDALVWPLNVAFVGGQDGFLPVLLVKYGEGSAVVYRDLAIFVTHDGGISWELAPGILNDMATFPPLQFISPQEAVVACAADLCITQDGARTWASMPLPESLIPNDARLIQQLEFVDSSLGWLIIRESTGGTANFELYKTTDGGVNWNPQ